MPKPCQFTPSALVLGLLPVNCIVWQIWVDWRAFRRVMAAAMASRPSSGASPRSRPSRPRARWNSTAPCCAPSPSSSSGGCAECAGRSTSDGKTWRSVSPIFLYAGEPTRRSRHGGSIREATFRRSSLRGLRPDDWFWFRFCLGVETVGFIGSCGFCRVYRYRTANGGRRRLHSVGFDRRLPICCRGRFARPMTQ